MTPAAFIFDYDGTLCDTHAAIMASLTATLATHLPVLPDSGRIAAMVASGTTLQETFRALHARPETLDDDELARWTADYRSIYRADGEATVTLFDGVRETLAALRDRATLILLSNKNTPAVMHSLQRFGLIDTFDLILGELPGLPRKPDPAVFTQRIATVFPDLQPGRCVVIGDTTSDIGFARNIGAQACFARYGHGDVAAVDAIGHDHALDAISDLLRIYPAPREPR